ncbi:MAG: hypothetical protein ACOX0A_07025 [Thermoguttaceae bacterium]|jgi:hypothetical protein
MGSIIRVLDSKGKLASIHVVERRPWREPIGKYRVQRATRASISVASSLSQRYARYSYLREQLALNAERTGVNLVDSERTRHILEGEPVVRAVESTLFNEPVIATTVSGWSGGHANPDAAKFGKTQIPAFWTNDRFMFEVSDVLADPNAQWRRQEDPGPISADGTAPDRYYCVEERYGVPIRVVADLVDNELRCVTAFPDYRGKFSVRDEDKSGENFSVK